MNPFGGDRKFESSLHYDVDNIYYNVTIKNTTDNIIRADFNEQRVEPIVNNPKEYELAVSRFSINTSNIPIFIWPGDNVFSITLTYLAVDYTVPIIFIPRRTTNIYGIDAIWYVNEMIQNINLAIGGAMGLAGILPSTPYGIYLSYNPNVTASISLFIDRTIPNYSTLSVSFNRELFPYVQSIPMAIVTTDNIKYATVYDVSNVITETGRFGHLYDNYTSEYDIIPSWSGVYSYIFATTMPLISENNSGQSNIRQTVITDFLPDQTENDKVLQYAPSVLRFYSLAEGIRMDQINLSLQWRDINDKIYPIYLEPNKFVTVKLLFRKKIANQFEELNDSVSGNR